MKYAIARCAALTIIAAVVGWTTPASAQGWPGFATNAQHSGAAGVGSLAPELVKWTTSVDLDPQYSGGELTTHYGSPVITVADTVIVPVKTGASGGFQVDALRGVDGSQLWVMTTDYALPSHNWTPPLGVTLTPNDGSVAIPGAGGTVIVRGTPNLAGGATTRLAFFGIAAYNSDPAAFNAAIQICTPITSDSQGNLYFGYFSNGAALPGFPNGVASGLARLSSSGQGSFISATAMSGSAGADQVAFNCAPALSPNGAAVYVAVNTAYDGTGYLCAVNSSTLAPISSVALVDPSSGGGVTLDGDAASSPTVGADGDVYFGVLEQNPPSHHERGWMLHFNAALSVTRIPGSFGWDDTPSLVPASAVPSYHGASTYLLLTNYNDYADPGDGGSGENKVAVLDPNATEPDPVTPTVQVMKEVLTILGPTKNPGLPGVYEWSTNAAAVDPVNRCADVTSEDGHLYRWSFTTNTLADALSLTSPASEAYTPTLVGSDGAVYAISDAILNRATDGSNGVNALNVSSSVSVTRGGYIFNRSLDAFVQTVTLKNTSASTINGPIYLALTSLSSDATAMNVTATTYLTAPSGSPCTVVQSGSLAPGASTSVALEFSDPTMAAITYSTIVMAGPGSL